MGGRPHALLIPFPEQGHVSPLLELAHRLADAGVLVTFVNTERNHARMMEARPQNSGGGCADTTGAAINMAAIPDGLGDEIHGTYFSTIQTAMPVFLEELILKINEREENKITCVIADGVMAWLLEVAKKLNIPRVAFWPPSAWLLAILRSIPTLIESGIIDQNGFRRDSDQLVKISDKIPAMNPDHLCWLVFEDKIVQSDFFKYLCDCVKAMEGLDCILCNTFPEIEAPALELIENGLPIGPLIAIKPTGCRPRSFWAEDFSCISWLDRQPVRSVVYVSFGSVAMLSKEQFHQFALGLEITGRPFIWVCRPGLLNESSAVYPDGFIDRVAGRGLIVEWAPQREVLLHPSIACFLTHCGWTSPLEAIAGGVPLLCFPSIADHFLNQQYIVDVWKIGLELKKGEEGIAMKEEIRDRLEETINDEGIRKRVLELKDKAGMALMGGGISSKNLNDFILNLKAS